MAAKSKAAPGADRIYAIALVHLILCIIIIAACTPGTESLSIGGVQIAPTLQWCNTAFTAFTIVCIILAAVGTLYLIEWHLDVYLGCLVVSIAIDLVWFGVFLVFGSSCASGESTTSCSFNAGGVILGITAIVLFKLFAAWSVMKAKRAVRIKYNEELLPYLRRSLAKSVVSGPGMLEDEAGALNADQLANAENAKVSFAGVSGPAGAGGAASGYGSYGAGKKSVGFATGPHGAASGFGTGAAASGFGPGGAGYASAGGAGNAGGMVTGTGVNGTACMATPGGYGSTAAAGNSLTNTSYYGSGNQAVGVGLNQGLGSVAAAAPMTGSMGPASAQPVAIASNIAPIGTATTTPVMTAPGTPTGTTLRGTQPASMPCVRMTPPPSQSQPPMFASGPPQVLQSMAAVPATPVAVPIPGSATISAPCAGPSLIAGAEAIFNQIDKDGDGLITREEVEQFRSGQFRSGSVATSDSGRSG